MQFSMARKFTLQPLHRYDIKPPEKGRRWKSKRIQYRLKKSLNIQQRMLLFLSKAPLEILLVFSLQYIENHLNMSINVHIVAYMHVLAIIRPHLCTDVVPMCN
jgi:hypothetical protein